MKKLTFILALFIMASWTAYGQEVIGYGTIAKGDNSLNQQLPWSKYSLRPNELNEPNLLSEKHNTVDRIDPFMPIAVPPKDSIIKFPIKVIPESFPSNMPVARLPDSIDTNLTVKGKRDTNNHLRLNTPGNLPHLLSPLRRLVPHPIE